MDEKLVEGNFSLEAYTRHSFFNDTTEMLAARNIKAVSYTHLIHHLHWLPYPEHTES